MFQAVYLYRTAGQKNCRHSTWFSVCKYYLLEKKINIKSKVRYKDNKGTHGTHLEKRRNQKGVFSSTVQENLTFFFYG